MLHGSPVKVAAFSPNGKQMVTGTEEGVVRLWDAESGKALSDPLLANDRITSIRFNPDGTRIMAVSGNRLLLWDLPPVIEAPPEWLLPLAGAVAGRHLSERGVLEPPGEDSAETLRKIREQLIRSETSDSWTKWGRWFLADRATRAISPFSRVTSKEAR